MTGNCLYIPSKNHFGNYVEHNNPHRDSCFLWLCHENHKTEELNITIMQAQFEILFLY